MAAKTSAQVIVDYTTDELDAPSVASFDKFRKMRRDPTIALAREFSVAPILASTWTVEGEDEDQVSFVEQVMLPMRTHLLRTALYGEIDFGWKAYEKVFAIRDVEFPSGLIDKSQVLDQVKPLKNDPTRARYRKEDGRFMGLATENLYTGEKILIDAEHSLFVNFDDEGLGNYAEGRMQRVMDTYDQWNDCNDSASRYDRKLAGTFLVVEGPMGKTLFNGVETDNAEIGEKIIKALTSNGAVYIPKEVQDLADRIGESKSSWNIEFLDTNAKQASFVDRQKYLDALKARGFAVPERAILEGEFGTKAEAGIHASAAMLNMHLKHENLTEFFNWHIVNQLLMLNWGVENTTRLRAMPLTNEKSAFFTQLLTALMADPVAGPDIAAHVDVAALLEAVDVPLQSLEEGDETESATVGADPEDTNQPATPPADTFKRNGQPQKVTVSVG